jgi:hypothetical protein
MSKEAKEKKIITVEQAPILVDLGLPELYHDYKKYAEKEVFHKTKVTFYERKRNTVKESIRVAMVEADPDVDTVVYTDPKGLKWQSTIVKPESPDVLDQELLKRNMMKVGKLPAPIVQDILAKSMVPGKKKQSYVLVTEPTEGKDTK